MKSVNSRRIEVDQLTAGRFAEAIKRRLIDLPHRILWGLGADGVRLNKANLRTYKDIHKDQRCVIIGNGPSLKAMDLSVLKNEYTFGLNRIYLLFDQLMFKPTYFVSINELVLRQFSNEIATLSMPKFINWNARSDYAGNDESVLFLKDSLALNDKFSLDITKNISSGGTVTYVAMQIAYFMGFTEVYLIGVDHSFKQQGIPNTVELRESAEDLDHFHPDYFPKGSKWQLPDLVRSELAYQLARSEFELDNRKIFDATVNGKCDVFEKVDFDSVFKGN